MAYAMRPDGLADVQLPDGSIMPMALSPEQLEAMGHSTISDAAQRPDMGPDLRVAGPGGSPFGVKLQQGGDIGNFGPPGAGSTPFGSGISKPADKFAGVRVRLGEDQQAPSGVAELGKAQAANEELERVNAMSPAARQAYYAKQDAGPAAGKGAPELAAHTEPRGKGAPAGPDGEAMTPEEEAIFRESLARQGGGGGPVRDQRYLKGQTEKRTIYGDVPTELRADIAARGHDLEETQNDNLTDRAADRAKLLDQRDAALTRQMDDVIDQRVQRQQVDAKLANYQRVRDQQQQQVASMKAPDMHAYWEDKGIASHIMTGISIALGGYLQGLRGGENPGLTMANQAIDRWMSSQKDAYDRKRGAAMDADNQYAKALALYGTPEQAEHEMRNQAYAVRDAMLANQLGKVDNADAFAKGQELLKASALERQQANAKGYQLAGERAVETTYATRQTGGGGRPSLLKAYQDAAAGKKVVDYLNGKTDVNGKALKGAAASPLAVRFPDGGVRLAGSSKEKASAQKVIRSAWGGMNDVDRLIQLTDSAGSRAWGSEERGQAEALASALLLKVHDAHGIATFQEATANLMHNMIGDPTSFARNPAAIAKLKEVRRGLEDAIHEQHKFLAPASGNADDEGGAESDNDLPDSAQEIVE